MSRSLLIRLQYYGVAISTILLALGLTLALQSILSPTLLPLFFVAVAGCTWYGGLETGLIATLIAVCVIRYCLMPPLYTLFPLTSSMGITAIAMLLIVWIIHHLTRHLQRSHQHFWFSQTQVQRGQTRFRAAIESSFDAIYLLESVRDRTGEIIDFRFVDLNERGAQLISRTKTEILETCLCELLPVNRTMGFFEKYQQVVITRTPLEEEFSTAGMPDVTARWLQHHVVPLEDGIAITSRDISERKQAELAIAAREKLYRTLAESMSHLVWQLDRNGQIEYANPQWQQALGVTPAQINATGWEQLLHPEDAARILPHWQQAFTQSETVTAEFRYRMADGRYRWFLGQLTPINNQQGQAIRWIGSATDIETLKQFEQDLKIREHQFRTLAENSPDVISRLDREFRHLYVNSAITPATGLAPADFIGKTHADLGLPAAIYRPWLERNQGVFETGQGCSYEFQFPAPDGMRHYFARIVPELDATGAVATILGITSDITELKQTEQALRTSETRFRRVLESNMMGMGFWDSAGQISLANDALLHLIGYTQADVQAGQLSWQAITPSKYAEQDAAALQEIAAVGFCQPFEKEYRHRNGDRIPILCGGASFEDDNGSGVFFVIDLTAQKAIEKECDRLLKLERAARESAEATNRVKDEFLAVLSHELRTPLNPILGWTKLLQTRQFNPEQTARALQTIERNARLQAQLVEDLLDVATILRGKLKLNFSPVNVIAIVTAAIATLQLSAQVKRIALVTHFDASTGEILGNADRLQQIIWNLLSNAIKFTPQGGQVQISVQPMAGFAQIQISDTGQGITAEFLPYIFDYFRQSDSSKTRLHGGLGMGLAISRHLVELHGGTIEAASPGLGQGTMFTLRFPFLQPDDALTLNRDRGSAQRLETRLTGIMVLIVEADQDSQDLMRFVLEQAGAVVLTATSVGEALRLLDHTHPHILISDMGMPDEDGYSLMQQIEFLQPELAQTLHAIAIVPLTTDIDRPSALAAGYQRHLIKPVEPDALIAAVAGLTQPLL